MRLKKPRKPVRGKSPVMDHNPANDKYYTATQIRKMSFKSLQFDGMWEELFGNPDPNFSLMCYAKPKMGKSTIMIDFANYLATNFGNVLFVAIEETIRKTLQEKIIRLDADAPRLEFSGTMPATIPSKYEFVFIDSSNAARLDYTSIVRLLKRYPDKGFVFIFQSTKGGQFRGTQDIEHEVGIVMFIDEKGIAHIKGRYAPPCTLNVAKEYGLVIQTPTKSRNSRYDE